MDKIWCRNPSKSEAVVAGLKKTIDHAEPTKKLNAKKSYISFQFNKFVIFICLFLTKIEFYLDLYKVYIYTYCLIAVLL